MKKKSKKQNQTKSGNWMPPKNASKYFSAASDYTFRDKHPSGYVFLVLLGIVALFSPVVLYLFLVLPYNINSPWILLGWVGSFIIGIGFFNLIAITIKQYLGHIVTILSFVLGSIFIWISLVQMGIVIF